MRPCSGIRVAGIPSFCTKRWVFSDTLEKYTRLDDGTAISLRGERSSRERLDAIGTEAGPVLVSGHDHGRLQITQRHHVVPRLGIQRDVDRLVGNALLVQRLVRGIALHTCGLGVHGDGHRRFGSSAELLGTDWQLLGHYLCATARQTVTPRNSGADTAARSHGGAGIPEPHQAAPRSRAWGLSVAQTLHLVGDNKKGYKMFGTTFVKFPGRKHCSRYRVGVS